ncbi:hypothetical protein BC829DRAFT_380140, partial [Chytridium lagenaria]
METEEPSSPPSSQDATTGTTATANVVVDTFQNIAIDAVVEESHEAVVVVPEVTPQSRTEVEGAFQSVSKPSATLPVSTVSQVSPASPVSPVLSVSPIQTSNLSATTQNNSKSPVMMKSAEPLTVEIPKSPSAVSDAETTPLSKCGSEMIMNSPIATVQEGKLGSETTCLHVLFQSRLGWMCWKDREATLFSLFERGFAATKACIKFNDTLDQFGVEVEVPNEQVANLERQLRGKSLLQEIGRIHGLSPALRVSDARVLKVTKTLGTTIKSQSTKSSIESLQNRLKALEGCGGQRVKEVQGMCELWNALQMQVNGRFKVLEEKLTSKPERLGRIEGDIVDMLNEELKSIQA